MLGSRTGGLLLLGLLLGGASHAGVRGGAYAEAIRLIDSLYLYPDEVDAGVLLHASARGLSERVDWLLVEGEGRSIYLNHGDGTHLGSLSVASIETLPEALLALEDLVISSGFDLDGVDVRLGLLQGLTGALDRYSTVLAGDRLERFDVRLKGTMVGVGLSMRSAGEAMVITDVLADSPASKAGLEVGDRVVRIDGLSVMNLPLREATRRIRGEAGTLVGLTVLREGRTREIFLTREEIVVPNVEHRVLEGNVGYIRITHFSQRTDENLRLALNELQERGGLSGGLVIDLRGNTGGSMKDSARSADELVHEGTLLRTSGRGGRPVRNLQARMDARSVGNEPDVPVIVLMNGRTASGSEIMAGALVELGRAALVGHRSFGKGTVQKVYPIDPEARLKLTVARYLLAGDRQISSDGLAPDVAVEDIVLDRGGVRVRRVDQDEEEDREDGAEAVQVVVERFGWREKKRPSIDERLELARRAVLGARGPDREDILLSLRQAGEEMRGEHAERLAEALLAREIDWSLTERSSTSLDAPPQVAIQLRTEPADGDLVRVELEIENLGSQELEQVWVELDCQTFSAWRGIAYPIGRLAPGATARGVHFLRPSIGLELREDVVTPRVRAAGRAELLSESVALSLQGPPSPEIAVSARYVDAGEQGRAEVTVHNLGSGSLSGIEVAFGHPGEVDVELLDHAALIPELAPSAAAQVGLRLQPGASAPERLPLGLVVSQGGRRAPLVEWPVDLPRDGSEVYLRAPRITFQTEERSGPVGLWALPLTVADETRLDHVVVYLNDQKIAWAPGGGGQTELVPRIPLKAGQNRVTVVAYDEHGLRTNRSLVVRGELPISVDADSD
ncbi:MAG: PDZ domain-containing protein [Deltaproteobacteria bacterium]|nr:MAG: PDZ domain-containing protein [Deltaproteobacteria bacterium]